MTSVPTKTVRFSLAKAQILTKYTVCHFVQNDKTLFLFPAPSFLVTVRGCHAVPSSFTGDPGCDAGNDASNTYPCSHLLMRIANMELGCPCYGEPEDSLRLGRIDNVVNSVILSIFPVILRLFCKGSGHFKQNDCSM